MFWGWPSGTNRTRDFPISPGIRSRNCSRGRSAGALLRLALGWVAAKAADHFLELFRGLVEARSVGAAQHQGHAEIAAAVVGVGADFEVRIDVLQRGQILGDRPLGEGAADAAAQHFVAADEAML